MVQKIHLLVQTACYFATKPDIKLPSILIIVSIAKFIKTMEFEKWLAIRASVGGVGGVLAWVTCQRGWHAYVGDVLVWVWRGWRAYVAGVLAWVTWVACLRGWCASVLTLVACQRGWRANVVCVVGVLARVIWVVYVYVFKCALF